MALGSAGRVYWNRQQGKDEIVQNFVLFSTFGDFRVFRKPGCDAKLATDRSRDCASQLGRSRVVWVSTERVLSAGTAANSRG